MSNKNVFLFHGLDTFSSKKYLNFWKNSFIKKYGDNADYEEHEGKKINIKSLLISINSLPFLCDKRLIIINDIFSNRKTSELRELADIIETVPDKTIIIFYENKNAPKNLVLYKRIAKFGEVKEFKEFSANEGIKLIAEITKKNNATIDTKTSQYLFNYLSGNAWTISNEIKKLSTFTDLITIDIINENVTEALNSSIFKLTDALSAQNLRVALNIFKTLLNSGDSPMQIFFMIVRNFRILIEVKDLMQKNLNKSQIAKELQINPFIIMQAMRHSRNFELEKLKMIYKNLMEIDLKLKTGGIKISVNNKINYILQIELLIIDICKNS